jgi:hypothetical protein
MTTTLAPTTTLLPPSVDDWEIVGSCPRWLDEAEQNTNSNASWKHVDEELIRFRSLGDDWDGEGSDAPPDDLIDTATSFARHLCCCGESPPDRILASVNGTVLFEWFAKSGYLCYDIHKTNEVEGRWAKRGDTRAILWHIVRKG